MAEKRGFGLKGFEAPAELHENCDRVLQVKEPVNAAFTPIRLRCEAKHTKEKGHSQPGVPGVIDRRAFGGTKRFVYLD